jgi:hypothetical protein
LSSIRREETAGPRRRCPNIRALPAPPLPVSSSLTTAKLLIWRSIGRSPPAEQQEHWDTGISQKSTYSVFVDGDERVDSSTGFVRVASTAALTAGVASTRQDTCVGGVGGIDDVTAPWSRQSRGYRDNA